MAEDRDPVDPFRRTRLRPGGWHGFRGGHQAQTPAAWRGQMRGR